MVPNNPRIIIADDSQGLATITRSALELMGRRPRVIEAHTGEDALDEARLRAPDLLITGYKLGSTMTGVMLALQAKREAAAVPVIVIATESDLELDQETLADSPFHYLRRPFVPELFIRALRIALDGPEAVPAAEVPVDALGPVPEVDVDKLRQISAKLMREVGAMSVILSDRNGKVLTYDGAAGYIDRDVLSAGLGPTFASTARILPIVGDQPRVLKYYDGDKFDIFSLAIGLHYFVSLVFDGASGDRALGSVRRWGGTAVNEMLAIVGDAAFAIASPVASLPEVPKAPEPQPAPKHRGRRRTQEMSALKTQSVPSAKKAEAVPAPISPQPPLPVGDPITDFDASILDGLASLDLSQADALFDPARLESLASPLVADADSRISINDAQAQGIIGPLDE